MNAHVTARHIRDALADIVELYDEVLEPQRPMSGVRLPTVAVEGVQMRYAGRVMRHSPPPISAAILDARREAHKDLLHYARVVLMACVDINGAAIVTRVDHDSIPALCDFLDTWALILAGHDPIEAVACDRDMTKHAKVLRATAYPERRDWITIGECPCEVVDAEGERGPCGAKVRAYGDRMSLDAVADPDARVSFIVCPVCGHEDTLSWWLARTVPEGADLAPAETVIAFVSLRTQEVLTHAQLRQWATRAFVRRHGRDEKGRTLYSCAAVLAYAQDQTQEMEVA